MDPGWIGVLYAQRCTLSSLLHIILVGLGNEVPEAPNLDKSCLSVCPSQRLSGSARVSSLAVPRFPRRSEHFWFCISFSMVSSRRLMPFGSQIPEMHGTNKQKNVRFRKWTVRVFRKWTVRFPEMHRAFSGNGLCVFRCFSVIEPSLRLFLIFLASWAGFCAVECENFVKPAKKIANLFPPPKKSQKIPWTKWIAGLRPGLRADYWITVPT